MLIRWISILCSAWIALAVILAYVSCTWISWRNAVQTRIPLWVLYVLLCFRGYDWSFYIWIYYLLSGGLLLIRIFPSFSDDPCVENIFNRIKFEKKTFLMEIYSLSLLSFGFEWCCILKLLRNFKEGESAIERLIFLPPWC